MSIIETDPFVAKLADVVGIDPATRELTKPNNPFLALFCHYVCFACPHICSRDPGMPQQAFFRFLQGTGNPVTNHCDQFTDVVIRILRREADRQPDLERLLGYKTSLLPLT